MKKGLLLALVLFVLFLTSSCNLFQLNNYEFINDSSYAITITPNGQTDWTAFILGSYQNRTISISENNIYFLYNNASLVYDDTSVSGKIYFYDR
jgi:hypothetical protein